MARMRSEKNNMQWFLLRRGLILAGLFIEASCVVNIKVFEADDVGEEMCAPAKKVHDTKHYQKH